MLTSVWLRFCRGSVEGLKQFKYTLSGVPLNYLDEHKDLGVTVDVKLRYHSHIQGVV